VELTPASAKGSIVQEVH